MGWSSRTGDWPNRSLAFVANQSASERGVSIGTVKSSGVGSGGTFVAPRLRLPWKPHLSTSQIHGT
jgi:hypothetical protein